MSPIETLIAALKRASENSWWRDDERDGFVDSRTIDTLIEDYERQAAVERRILDGRAAGSHGGSESS